MSSTTKRTLGLALWLALVAAAIRPIGPLERAIFLLRAPLRPVAELAGPLAILRGPEVRAAEADLLEDLGAERRAGDALLTALARHATPTDPALVEGRRLVHGEVVGRAGSADRLRVRVRDARALAVGLPVVHGAVYVGRVGRVGPKVGLRADEVEVELVTGARNHVGARVEDADGRGIDVIVGGLDGRRRLAVSSPSDRGLEGGLARVHARLPEFDPYAALAEGYRIGRVSRAGEQEVWSVEPELDYKDGLFHVVVLAPPDPALPSDEPMPQAIADQAWRRARPLSHGDPSPWREALVLAAGSGAGVRPGAAVAFGARLVGRVGAVGPWTSDAHLLGDPGLTVVAVAILEEHGEPHVLGRLASLGRGADGRVRLRQTGGEPLALEPDGPDGRRRAQLFTGSGDAGVPSGLLIGDARVPVDGFEGERVVVLLEDDALLNLRELWVRVPEDGGQEGAP